MSDPEPPGPSPRGTRAVDRLARALLPHPRDVAFANLVRSVRDLVLGRRPRSIVDAARAVQAEEHLRIHRSRDYLDRGDPAAAAAEAKEIERLDPANKVAGDLRAAAARSEPIRGRSTNRLAAQDVQDAQAQLVAEGHARPAVLLYHQASPDSPYQDLVYRQAWQHGIAPIPLHDLADLAVAERALAPETRRILHLHWVNRVLAGATGPDEADRRVAAAAATLDRARQAGWAIAWTVHNILPHDAALPEAEAHLRRTIVDRADLVHVMTASTAELAAPLYRIPPERTVHVPLPSFRGAYADIVSRSAARFSLGLPGDARVISLVGGLRPYKGLDLLLDGFDRALTAHPDLHLLIAGLPSRSPEIGAFVERAVAQRNVHLHGRMIPADDMQLFLRASDAVVLPYVRTLNSALLMLALAFDLPVIAPDLGGIPEIVGPEIATIFPAGDVDALAEALGAVRTISPETATIARRICDTHDADVLSGRLMVELRQLVDARAPGRAGTAGSR